MYPLEDVATFGALTVKERTGRQAKIERLPRWSVWRGDTCLEEFRHRADAIRWAKVNS